MRSGLEQVQAGEQHRRSFIGANASRASQQDDERLSANWRFADQYAAFCDLLEQEDRRVIRELKLALRMV